MNNSIIELLARLFNSQQNFSPNQNFQNNTDNNPAFANYPKEAYIQSNQRPNAENNNFSSQPNNLANLLGLLGGNGNENNMLPLLLSMLGKNPASIVESLSKVQTHTEKNDKFSVDDDILL